MQSGPQQQPQPTSLVALPKLKLWRLFTRVAAATLEQAGRIFAGIALAALKQAGRIFAGIALAALKQAGRMFSDVALVALERPRRTFTGIALATPKLVGHTFATIALAALWLPGTALGDAAPSNAEPLFGRAVAFAQPNSVWDQEWQRVKAKLATQSAVRLDFLTRGERGSEEQMLHDIRRGRAHLGGMSLQGLASTVPELNIAMAPYMFDSAPQVDFVYDHYLFELFDALFAEKNLTLVQWVEVGWNGIYSQVPIRLPQDAKGLRLRGSPNPATQLFLASIGADSIPLGSSDLVPSLQTGLIEGGVSAVIFHYFLTRGYASHLTLSRHSYDTGAIVANKAWMDSATLAQRAVVRGAWGDAATARAAVRSLADGAIAQMRQGGIAIQDLNDAEVEAWRSATSAIVPALIESIGGASRAVFDAIKAGKKAFQQLETGAS